MHEFFEASFDLENTFEYILSIQVSLNGFSFSILDTNHKKVVAFKSVPLKISDTGLLARRFKDWYKEESILHQIYKHTRLIIFSNKYTLVPDKFVSASSKEEIPHLLFHQSNTLKFAENVVKPLEAKLLFSLPEGLLDTISETLGECEMVHPVKPLILSALNNNAHSNLLGLLFNDRELYVLVKKQNKIILNNCFAINHSNDALYFILTTLSQLGISSKEITAVYAGISSFKEEIVGGLGNYFAAMEPLGVPADPLPTEVINKNISLFL